MFGAGGRKRAGERLRVQGAVVCLVGETSSAAAAVFQWEASGWLIQARVLGAADLPDCFGRGAADARLERSLAKRSA